MLLKSWVLEYVNTYKRITLKPSTVQSYLYAAAHIPDDIVLDELTREDLQCIINKMVDAGLAWSTVSHTFTLVSDALSHAQNYGLPDKSYLLKGVIMPKRQKKRVRAFLPEELQRFRQNNKSVHADVFEFLLQNGLRIGELIGLQQRDFDVRSRLYVVDRTYYRDGYQGPKTPESKRSMPLTAQSWEIVRSRIVLGQPTAPVFLGRTGKILNYRSVLESFDNTLDKAGLHVEGGLHILRHTFATELLRRGVSLKVISELLGHGSIKTTCDIYSDVTLDMKLDALATLNASPAKERLLY